MKFHQHEKQNILALLLKEHKEPITDLTKEQVEKLIGSFSESIADVQKHLEKEKEEVRVMLG